MIEVERNSFYVNDGGRLRYTEHSSDVPHAEHFECGCTKNASERPAGAPSQVNQDFRLVEENSTFHLAHLSLTLDTFGGKRGYFQFGKKQSSVKIEVSPIPDFGRIEVLMGKLYLGNKIDLSSLYNGHSPSRVVDLSKIDPARVWVHDCSWGVEAVRFLDDAEEAAMWRAVFEHTAEIDRLVSPLVEDCGPVDGLRNRVADSVELISHARAVRALLTPFVERVADTATLRIIDEADRAVTPDRTEEERRESRERARTILNPKSN